MAAMHAMAPLCQAISLVAFGPRSLNDANPTPATTAISNMMAISSGPACVPFAVIIENTACVRRLADQLSTVTGNRRQSLLPRSRSDHRPFPFIARIPDHGIWPTSCFRCL